MPFTNKKESDAGLEKMRMGGFWFRKWNSRDVTHLFLVTQMHVLAACAPFVPSWKAFGFAVFLWYLTTTGVTLASERSASSKELSKHMDYEANLDCCLGKTQMTTSSTNNSVFRGFFEKQELTGPNFIDWYRQLRIILSIEDKLNYLEHPIPPAPVAPAGQQVAPEILAAHNAWIKGSNEIVGLMLMTIDPEIQRNLEPLHAHEMLRDLKTLFSQQAEKELLQTTRDFHSYMQEEGQSVSLYVLKMKGYIDNLERLGHPNYNMHSMGKTVNELHAMLKLPSKLFPKATLLLLKLFEQYLAELLKKKKNATSGAGGSGIFVIELNTILNRSWIYDIGCGTHICNTTQGLRASRKLKSGPLSLFMGNGQREAVEAIGAFYLCLPSGLEIVLNNCHYAPSITRRVISVSCLYEDGFVNRFVDNTIQVSRNNVVYFSAIPRDGIFEIDLSNSLTNESSIYDVSNKRAKLDLDSTLLWHCRHGHISKKRIEKLQHDRLLDSSDFRAFEKCVSCMSGKMERKSYTHQVERAKDLLGLIHTNEVENQLGKTIKSLRSDCGGEYMSKEFLDHLKDHGTITHRTPPYTPQHNGYPKETMGYSFYYPPENKVLVARNAEFLENSLINQEASGSLEDLEIIQEEDTHPFLDTSLNHEDDDLEIDEPQRDLSEPTNYKAALLDPEFEKWLNAMNVEMQSMKDNEVWVLVELPPNGKTVGSKWLFKKKTDTDGNVHIYKARLVAKGYTQTTGIDYEKTFSPVADIRAIRIFISIAAYYDYEIWKIDVKTSFLNGYLNEEVYMKKPEGFVNPKYPNRVCMLKRSIYGLKQASRQWNKRFDDEIKKFGFTQNRHEPCVYLKASESNIIFLILYVDDILIMGNNIPMLQSVKTYLGKCFDMKDLGEAAYILGIKIYIDRSRRLIGLCQSAYIKKILKRYYMENSKRGSIPMQEKLKLSKIQGASRPAELKRMQNVPYASAVGDIHWPTVKNILKYLRNTKEMFLAYGEAEYIAAFDASKEAVWVRKFIFGLGVVPTIEEPMSMYCDNTEAIAIANESGIMKSARHFRAKVHYLREVIEFCDIKLEKFTRMTT
uniref:Retrotransposon protein, putative, Ty1-copia subclass n=1 Tax=Tanacetum cinerariifolium TaxID=118510 RepID=A0A6L2KEK8_TANCI|nr:retrotransposon protein, putative, Ty1-copia subclass [Tanacetum cinerariifolium]